MPNTELEHLRNLVREHLVAFLVCPDCDYEVEVDPAEQNTGQPCSNCWSVLQVEVRPKDAAFTRSLHGHSHLEK